MATPRSQEILSLLATLELEISGADVIATILFSKAPDDNPICAQEVALIPETQSGALLSPVVYPQQGPIPEVTTVATTASLDFAFKIPPGDTVRRVLLVMKGHFVVFNC